MPLLGMLLWGMLLGCAKQTVNEQACSDICGELAVNCAFEAYPDFGSCEQGCLFEADKGEDMEAELACLRAAECDTFAVIDCENSTW